MSRIELNKNFSKVQYAILPKVIIHSFSFYFPLSTILKLSK